MLYIRDGEGGGCSLLDEEKGKWLYYFHLHLYEVLFKNDFFQLPTRCILYRIHR